MKLSFDGPFRVFPSPSLPSPVPLSSRVSRVRVGPNPVPGVANGRPFHDEVLEEVDDGDDLDKGRDFASGQRVDRRTRPFPPRTGDKSTEWNLTLPVSTPDTDPFVPSNGRVSSGNRNQT